MHIQLPDDLAEAMEPHVEDGLYSNHTDLTREALREKLDRLE